MIDENPERALALSYARPADRPALAALLALDDALASLLRTTREPAIAQIRLAWWREQLAALDVAAPPAMPVLEAISQHVLSRDIERKRMVDIVEGWEVLIETERLDRTSLADYADRRGGALFALGGVLLGATVSRPAGEGWALADLSRHLGDGDEAKVAREMASERLAQPMRWPRETRVLGALAAIAAMDLTLPHDAPPPIGAPRRVARLAWMRLTGR